MNTLRLGTQHEHALVGPPGLGRQHRPRVLEPPQGGEAEDQVVADGQRVGPGGGVERRRPGGSRARGRARATGCGPPPAARRRRRAGPTRMPRRARKTASRPGKPIIPNSGAWRTLVAPVRGDGRLEHVVEGEALVDGAQALVGVVEVAPPVEAAGGRRVRAVAGLEAGHGAGRLPAWLAERLGRQPRPDGRHARPPLPTWGVQPSSSVGPGPRVGPVAGGDVDAVAVERRLARPAGRGPGRLHRPGRGRRTAPAGTPNAGAGRPAPSASSPRMRRMGVGLRPAEHEDPVAPLAQAASRPATRSSTWRRWTRLRPSPGNQPHAAGQQAGDPGQHARRSSPGP